ncbi:MAG: hypothetical protein AAF492_02140 [Verrucomicrobiota bacterium]
MNWKIWVLWPLLPLEALACLNAGETKYTTLDGRSTKQGSHPAKQILDNMRTKPADRIPDFQSRRKASGKDPMAEADLNVVETILSGDPAAGIVLLQRMEAETPGRYNTAANLGTAYELSGDNRNALTWIREGIERNPKAHDGTEWLHAVILETKIELEQDPDYLKKRRIIELPRKIKDDGEIDIEGRTYLISAVHKALL